MMHVIVNRECNLVPSICEMGTANLGPHANLIIQWEQWDIVHQHHLLLICLLLHILLGLCLLLWALHLLLLICDLNWLEWQKKILIWAEFLLLETHQAVQLGWFSPRLGLYRFLSCNIQVRVLFLYPVAEVQDKVVTFVVQVDVKLWNHHSLSSAYDSWVSIWFSVYRAQ